MLYEQIQSNKRKTVVFIIGFFLLVEFCGVIIGEVAFDSWLFGVHFSTQVLFWYMLVTLIFSKSIVMKMNHARKAQKEDYPMLFNIVEEVCLSARLKTIPEIYIIKENSPNAFATGFSPNKSAIGVTTALLEKLNREELEAVIAHEVGHIMNYDVRLSTVSLALMSVVIILCDMRITPSKDDDSSPLELVFAIIFMIVAPIVAKALHFALSRNREYLADATAIQYTRNPQALISALNKIDGDSDIVDNIPETCASLYIADPLKKRFDKYGNKKNKVNIFSTHPAIEDRIDRLSKM